MQTEALVNPFPGLRPFEPDEDHLFFGRENQIDELLRKLRTNRFLMVTGSSGSGKSSLVRSGLIPSLYSGMMANAGSSWRVAILRPGAEPIGNLAAALDSVEVLGESTEDLQNSRLLVDVTLRRSSLGLIDAVRQARVPAHENVLILVDQFEELFRFRSGSGAEKNEAAAFVKLLLAAVQQTALPIYVVLTMRADFIGDCMNFLGLPEAINTGQYLVPRMTRDQLRSAITGPVAVAGGAIAARLVSRLLNDCGDDPDQLPVLQHALMRSWDEWMRDRTPGEPIDLRHYEAIGGMAEALSRHAEEAFQEASVDGQHIAERVFKSLTDTYDDARGVRRPRPLKDLCAICERPENEVVSVIDLFRRRGRCFLMPGSSVDLDGDCIIDLSHESLMRRWKRLVKWTEQEKASTEEYMLLSQAACNFAEGKAGLWRSPELDFGLRWREENHPNATWAGEDPLEFQRALAFLEQSAEESRRLTEERRMERRKKLRQAWTVAAALALLLLLTTFVAFFAVRERNEARKNLNLAKDAFDSMWSPATNLFTQIAADSPELEEYRQRLTSQAMLIARKIVEQDARQEFREELALIDLRLGDGARVTGYTDQAISNYRSAIQRFGLLAQAWPQNDSYQSQMADAYNWLGEAQRQSPQSRSEAEASYNTALTLLQALSARSPQNHDYVLATARVYYDRGIAREGSNRVPDAQADYQEAIGLLRPLASITSDAGDKYRQELARAENNLAQLTVYSNLQGDALRLYEDAIKIARELSAKHADNRDYKFELALYLGNRAILLEARGDLAPALAGSQASVALLEELAQPASPLQIQMGLGYDIRGHIMSSLKERMAGAEYQRSIDTFMKVAKHGQNGNFHLWFGQALTNMAALQSANGRSDLAIPLLLQAIAQHQAAPSNYNLGWDYVFLVRAYQKTGLRQQAAAGMESLKEIVAKLSGVDQADLQENLLALQKARR
jgi:energy-coupling factor transporter ATP-binding protein EcfA2